MGKYANCLGTLLLVALWCPAAPAPLRVVLLADEALDAPADYGLEKLRQSLAAKGVLVERTTDASAAQGGSIVLAGLSSSPRIASALKAVKAPLPQGQQALAIRHGTFQGRPALVLCGSDPRGLMYAALDTADRVSYAHDFRDPFSQVLDTSETPYILERGISMYTMQRAYFESRLSDENYWKRYFDLLARSRINTFTVIFGYENGGFMAPPYPYFFDVASHPEVRLVGIDAAGQARSVAAFRRMIALAHERGIEVIPAIWDHIYRGGVQTGGIAGAAGPADQEVPGLVTGLTAENLSAYTKDALRHFLEVFPEIDGLEFRMHPESGLKREEMPGFWHAVFAIVARAKPGLRLTLRAKELPDEIIDDALAQGLNARIETKYWMEQMGMPFHPTHINRQNQRDRRHGYADLLRYPQRYRVLFRLWNGGTTRLLLWGDPDYVRRFAASARVYNGNSIDVNEMLATKMLGEPHDRPPVPILSSAYRYYDYEFERYWHFYQVWGRVSYNPATPSEVWEREFERRFGSAGLELMQGLHTASKVLPRIVAAAYRYELFPTTRGWAEMMSQGDLPRFATLEGTDTEQFMSPRDEARSMLSGSDTSLRRPEETSRWFSAAAGTVLQNVRKAEAAGVSGKEARSTITDLKILAWLARYYAARLQAAVSYNLYREAGGLSALDQAIERETAAVVAWDEIVKAAGDVYSGDLAFGVHRVGFPRHWKEELANLQRGLEQLKLQRQKAGPAGAAAAPKPRPHSGDTQRPVVQLQPAAMARPGRDFRIEARVQDASSVKSMRLRYRHLTQFEDYQTEKMSFDERTGLYIGTIPGDFISPKWDLMYFIEATDKSGNGRNYPDLEQQAPYVIVPLDRPPRAALR